MKEWAKGFGTKYGWAVTPERTYITGTLMAHETIRFLVGRRVHAEAPVAIVIDLDTPDHMVRVVSPDKVGEPMGIKKADGTWHWNYKCF